jgi:flagellar biosynthesis protein FlhF
MTFIGRTTREAMSLAKARFGPEVEIVDSRQTPDGVELTAIVHGVPLQRRHLQPQVAPDSQRRRQEPAAGELPAPMSMSARGDAAAPLDKRPMSTVSFESYVRDRQERQPAQGTGAAAAPPGGIRPASAAHFPQQRPAASGSQPAAGSLSARLAMPQPAQAIVDAAARDRQNADSQSALLDELRSIKQFIAGQLETVRWFDTARRRPSQMRLLRLLLARQFSPVLSKSLCDLLPMDFSDGQADHWLRQTLARTLASFQTEQPAIAMPEGTPASLFNHGGVFALTGPTGVGKTTTVAKIAAQYAMHHGASQVALITADVYRIGAQEQLRSFGQMLGVPVHVAHDRAALQELLGLFKDRKLVLIDTAGVSQRDSRVAQLLAALDLDPIQRVVVLNAGMQAASLQDVASAYRAQDCAGVLLSKTDEAVQLGGAIDCLVRNRLRLLGFANGQRVPEDFHGPDFDYLVECAMTPSQGLEMDEGELESAEVRFILEGAHV